MNMLNELNEVVNQLTDNFQKSQSVNYLYKNCMKIVEAKLIEMEEYNFNSLLEWIDEIKSTTYKSKYKCIKRIIYALNNYICNNTNFNSSTRFVYLDDNSQFKKINESSKTIITNYLKNYANYDTDYYFYVRNYLSYYFLFLENKNIDYKNISYNELFDFKKYLYDLNLAHKTKFKILNITAKFIDNINADIKNKVAHIILKTIYNNYVDKIIKIDNFYLESMDYTTNNLNLKNYDSFYNHLINKGYSSKTIINSRKVIKELLFFIFYFSLPLNLNNALLWSKYVYEYIVKDNEYLSLSIKFIEFMQSGIFTFENCYFDSINNNPHKMNGNYNKFPEWSKYWVEKYIAYRKKLNYKKNTITMDYNSIFRFVTYLTDLHIYNFKQVRPEHLFSFSSFDKHSTIEGANAYLTRVRMFLIFLKDNNVINFYIDTQIFKGVRFTKKLIKIIENEDINKIISKEYQTPTELRAYAIFLLGIKCGLRSIDVVNLKFVDISFKNKTIKFIQIKTQKEITLPLPTIVLNAIYNYVKHGRPKSSSDYIFISHAIPYNKLARCVCARSFQLLKKINNIDNIDYTGFHICRKTFASNIINKTHDINLTAFSLGHSDNSTIDDYVSIEMQRMKECPLSLESINYGGFEDESI